MLFTAQAYFKMQNVLVDDRRIWVDLYVVLIIFSWRVRLMFTRLTAPNPLLG